MIEKATFLASLAGKQINRDELIRNTPSLDLRGVTVGANGTIEGTPANLDKLWKAIDAFDHDGNAQTVSDPKPVAIAQWVLARATATGPSVGGGGAIPGVGPLPPATSKWTTLATAGDASIKAAIAAHCDAIDKTGIGRLYGDHSSFHGLVVANDRAGIKDYVEQATNGKWTFKDFGPRMAVVIRSVTTGETANIEQSSCVGWQMKHSKAAHEAAGMGGRFAEINTRMREVHMLGSIHCEELKKDGWSALFCSAPDAQQLASNADYLAALRMAQRGTPLYRSGGVSGSTGIKPDDVIVGYRDSTPSASTQAQLDALAKIPFGIGIAKGGVHTYAVHNGMISEVHWDRDPTDKGIIQETPIDKWQWDQLVIMVPPKTYAKPNAPNV